MAVSAQARFALDAVRDGNRYTPETTAFASMTGKQGAVNHLSGVFREFRDEMGLRKKHYFHTLRHTLASWLVMGGTPICSVKEVMGHRDIEVTLAYSHLGPEAHRRDQERVFGDLTMYFGEVEA